MSGDSGERLLARPVRVAAGEDDGAGENAEGVRRDLVSHGRLFADFGLEPQANQLSESGSVPESLAKAPLIVDTDVGGDPDDAVALALAARRVPELALVVTSDERDGDRARFARHLLDALGRSDVPVVRGRQLTDTRYFCVDGVAPAGMAEPSTDVAGAVLSVVGATQGPVRWLGLGPATNLAGVLAAHPEVAARLALTQMGGAVRYRHPARAEHNFRLDPQAVIAVLGAVPWPHLVISDVTFRPEIEVSAGSPLYRTLARRTSCRWAALLQMNFDRWFADFHPSSMLHDPLTLTAALQLPFVEFALERVAVEPDGRMRVGEDGGAVFVSHTADYGPFLAWAEEGVAERSRELRQG